VWIRGVIEIEFGDKEEDIWGEEEGNKYIYWYGYRCWL